MRFPDSFLEEIRARLPISQVVGRHLQFDRKRSHPSRGDYWACCPFHHEKTPSFHVDDRKGYYYCFGCHAKGDHFRFLMEKEGLSFAEAVEQLAQEAGLPLPKPDPAREKKERKRLGLMEVLEEAARFYQRQLAEPAGAAARAYAERRGLAPDTIATFRIGAAPDARDALHRHLKKKGVNDTLMEEAGLIVVPEDGRPYDRFRHRLMFPIRDARGRVIAFGGRALGEARAKYLNSPETPVFHKSNVLFNLDLARKPAFERGEVVAVEGYMDVIAMHQAGFPHTVAPLGTALTESQLMALWRMAAQPVLCFDGDEAGLKAAWRALETALPHLRPGYSLRFAFLPDGTDPDDLIRLQGPGALVKVLEQAEPLIDFLFRHVCARHRMDTPENRAALEADMEGLAARITEPKVRQHYQAELRDRLNEMFGRRGYRGGRKGDRRAHPGRVAGRNGRLMPTPPPSAELKRVARGADPLGSLAEQDLLRIVLLRPDILPDVAEALANFPFGAQALDSLARVALDIAAIHPEEAPLASDAFLDHIRAKGLGGICERLLERHACRRLTRLTEGPAEQVAAEFLRRMEEMRRLRRLQQELEEAKAAFAAETTEENLARLMQVRAELDALEQLNE